MVVLNQYEENYIIVYETNTKHFIDYLLENPIANVSLNIVMAALQLK